MWHEGDPKMYVGLHISRNRVQRTIQLVQQRYIERLTAKFGMQYAIPVSIPAHPHSSLDFFSVQNEPQESSFP